ncbi:MAG: exodeoxyribonuclease V subunit alpha [Pseudomonadota bacterium]
MTPFWDEVARLAGAGQLRRLSGAFARFIGTLGKDDPALAFACVVLSELEGRGHSCVALADLAQPEWQPLAALAGPMPKHAQGWRALLTGCPQVWHVGDIDFGQPLVLDGERLYLRRYWRDETLVAQAIRARAGQARDVDARSVRHWIDILFASERRATHAPDWQKLACAVAVRGALAIITGGPGTGKTYTVARLLALLFALAPDPDKQRIALAAPTGKAAARLKQSIDKALGELGEKIGNALPKHDLGKARTLHSLLGARPGTRAFIHNRNHPLDVDVLIVDEASMVHLEMMAALLEALPPHAVLILLGDKDQLASVEAGAVLGDLCHEAQLGGYSQATRDYALAASGEGIPAEFAGAASALAQQTVMLRHSRRFGGPIGQLALAVNGGDGAAAQACLKSGDPAVQWIEHGGAHQAVQLAADGYAPYLALVQAGAQGEHAAWVKMVLQRFESFRILCAVRAGECGVEGLNGAIEARLDAAGLLARGGEWYVGRPVMVTRNDSATHVANGDIGLALPNPARPGALRVYFSDGETVRSVLATRLRDVETAFAMTVHKSQGSEFHHTVLVLPREGGALIARELVYTGITRASEKFTLVSSGNAVLMEAIARRTERASGLRDLIGK